MRWSRVAGGVASTSLALLALFLVGDWHRPLRASTATTPRVQTGLDRIASGEIDSFKGKRIGLIAHAASVTADGRHSIDVLRSAGVDLVRLFGPEHGLRSRAAAGAKVEDARDPVSGLPIVSLYGAKREPSAEDLKDLDALVFDLQGAGVRFYTYASTMILSLKAAARAGVPFVVLDRPNPLGGDRVEGPVSAPRDVVPASFVNEAPGPLVHGLTLGEMARLVNENLPHPAKLTVIPMRGWRRSMTWADTGLPWTPPSPNLVSPNAAIAYPGVAVLETTNVSEGRGTATPFLLLGAPWLRTADVKVQVPGFEMQATEFTPRSLPAAPSPKFQDQICRGFQVRVTDAAHAESYRFGIALLKALSRQPGFELRQDGAALTRLLGTPRVAAALEAGRSVDEIVHADDQDHARWRRERQSALLYP